MKPQRIWIIPCAFFLAACAVNLYACWVDNVAVERYVKGALMPLLSITTLAFLLPHKPDLRVVTTLLLAQLLGWAGDSLLMGDEFVWFASGIGCFLLGHVCYIVLFSSPLKGLSLGKWIVAVVVMAALLVAVVRLIGIEGALLPPMAVYGATLLFITFCGLCGVCRHKGPSAGVWWMVILGSVLFLFSDSLIAVGTFGKIPFPQGGFIIMVTYLAAQVLLCAAGIRLAVDNKNNSYICDNHPAGVL